VKLWSRYEVYIQNIQGIKLTTMGERHPEAHLFKGRVSHYVKGTPQILHPLLSAKSALVNLADYSDEAQKATHCLNFNPGILDGRTLVIDLLAEGGDMELASVSIPLVEISQLLEVNKQVKLERDFSQRSPYFEQGMKVRLLAKKVPMTGDLLGELAY
jgi:hypothetical protein